MKTVKFSAAVVVASSFVLGSSFAKASALAPYVQPVKANAVVQQLDVTPEATSASDLSESLRAGINDLSGARQTPATKVSRYKLNVDIGIGSIIDKYIGIPVMIDIGRGTDIVYVQQFNNPEDAKNAKRLCPVGVPIVCEQRSLPTNSKAARALHANEMVSMMFNKSFVGGVDFKRDFLNSKVNTGLKEGILLRGEFEAQVSKLDGDKVRLRVLVSKGHGDKGRAGIKVPIEVFALSAGVATGGISIVPYAQIDREKLEGAMKVTDLVFDLSNAEAAKAFDSVMSEAISIKDLINPVPFMATDLGPVYDLVRADQAKPEQQRRVSLVSTMSAQFHHFTQKNDIGIKLKALVLSLKLINKEKTVNENSITSTILDVNGNAVSATLDSNSKKSSNVRLLYGLIGSNETTTGSTAVLSMLNSQGQPTGEINFVVTQNLKDNDLKPSEQKEMSLLLQHRMSPIFAQRLNLTSRFGAEAIRNADIYTRVVFSNQALNSLSNRNAIGIEQAVQTYVSSDQQWLKFYANDVAEMSKVLETGVSSRNALQTRIEALNSLRANKAFQQIGTGLMMWLMDRSKLESSVAVKLYMRGLGRADTDLQVGTLANPAALAAAQFVDDELNGYDDMVSSLTLNATIVP